MKEIFLYPLKVQFISKESLLNTNKNATWDILILNVAASFPPSRAQFLLD